MKRATDWNLYYRKGPALSRFTRPITGNVLLGALKRYAPANPALAELGGAGSCFFDAVKDLLKPSEYHVIDNNQYGLDLLRDKVADGTVLLHNRNVLDLDLDLQLDAVFSVGLIEHFDVEGTRRAILAHLYLLKPGGIAVITFPTPTLLYRVSRAVSEMAGQWIFHDERPLRAKEVRATVAGHGRVLSEQLIWPIFFTQTLVVIQKE